MNLHFENTTWQLESKTRYTALQIGPYEERFIAYSININYIFRVVER